MSTARDLIIDQFPPVVESATRLTTWYAQGHSDGLGDRLLMFDNTSAPSWEILRFKHGLARDPRFETALRHRVERLSTFDHPAFPVVRSIKELGQGNSLAVVSTYVSGVRLSEALKKPRSAEFALQLIRQLMPALNALHEHGPALAHGAVTLDRVVLTADGRLMIREHMLGSALEGLEMSAAGLWSDFGILVPPGSGVIPRLDGRSDVAQLALVALSLVAGRRIGPDEYPQSAFELIERTVRLEALRRWLERALQLDDRAFGSVREATDALGEPQHQTRREGEGFEPSARRTSTTGPKPEPAPQNAARVSELRTSDPPVAERHHPLAPTGIVAVAPVPRRGGRWIRWTAVAATVIALAEAGFIGRMLLGDQAAPVVATLPPAPVVVPPPPAAPSIDASDQPATVTPLAVQIEQQLPGIRVLPAAAAGDAVPALPVPAPAPARNGGLRISSPIELHVLDGDRVLGSSKDGPIMTRAGRHDLEFVNSVIGYRVRRQVDVRAGEVTALSIAVPNGTLNINATPWAAVSIDGTSYGETPLGNVSVVPGEHEIVFRHPQLGERRERIVVRPETSGRVAVSLQR